VVSHLFNFRAVHHPHPGPMPEHRITLSPPWLPLRNLGLPARRPPGLVGLAVCFLHRRVGHRLVAHRLVAISAGLASTLLHEDDREARRDDENVRLAARDRFLRRPGPAASHDARVTRRAAYPEIGVRHATDH
jgi:hypothetical protein